MKSVGEKRLNLVATRRSPLLTPAPTAASRCRAAPSRTASPRWITASSGRLRSSLPRIARHRVEVPPHLPRSTMLVDYCHCRLELCLIFLAVIADWSLLAATTSTHGCDSNNGIDTRRRQRRRHQHETAVIIL